MRIQLENRNVEIHGHRGARGLYPENTLPAFEAAVKSGVDAIELDVVISADAQVVVSHEAWMNPVLCTQPDGDAVEDDREKYNLYRMSYNEIRRYDCGLKRHPDFPEQQAMAAHKPLLSEVIAAVEALASPQHPALIYNIEIKTEQPEGVFNPAPADFVKLVYRQLIQHKVQHRTHLQSFDLAILKEIKNAQLPLSIGLLVEDHYPLQHYLDQLGFVPDAYSPEFILLNPGAVKEAHDLGMRCIPWTVNETADMQRLLSWGVDGLITDYPDRAVQFRK